RLCAARVDDAATRVPSLLPEVAVELDAELDQVGDPRRRLLGQHADGTLAADAAPRSMGVLRVQRRLVVLTDRGGDTALGVVAVRREERPAREEQYVRVGSGTQSRVEPGDASADDDQIRFVPHSGGGFLLRVANLCAESTWFPTRKQKPPPPTPSPQS